ncbi:MAG TPA: hypothetical protein VE377_01995 [Candidatus Dormibacteraeota bacterium]|nr:hypothetical protein [Candidatus Dormibacteraeota bacterium]
MKLLQRLPMSPWEAKSPATTTHGVKAKHSLVRKLLRVSINDNEAEVMDEIVKDFLIESNENLDRLDQQLLKAVGELVLALNPLRRSI